MKSSQKQPLRPGMITALKAQKSQDRTSVFIDGQFALGVWTDLVQNYRLRVGQTLNQDDLDLLIKDEKFRKVRSAALQYLSYSPRTEFQIRQRLHQKGYSTLEITPVIGELIESGYIDDQKYAIEYAQARFDHKGYGPNRIRRELMADGICQELIACAIDVCVSSEDLTEGAKKIVERFQNRVHGTRQERKKKLIGYLIRRGYGRMLAQEIVQETLNQSESEQ